MVADCLQRGGQLDRRSFSHGKLSSYFSRLVHLYALDRDRVVFNGDFQ